jgi:hypothetical protein
MVHSQLEQQLALAQVLKQEQVLAQEWERVLVPELQRERRLVLAHFLRHPQLQSQFLLQQCHLREHEFR